MRLKRAAYSCMGTKPPLRLLPALALFVWACDETQITPVFPPLDGGADVVDDEDLSVQVIDQNTGAPQPGMTVLFTGPSGFRDLVLTDDDGVASTRANADAVHVFLSVQGKVNATSFIGLSSGRVVVSEPFEAPGEAVAVQMNIRLSENWQTAVRVEIVGAYPQLPTNQARPQWVDLPAGQMETEFSFLAHSRLKGALVEVRRRLDDQVLERGVLRATRAEMLDKPGLEVPTVPVYSKAAFESGFDEELEFTFSVEFDGALAQIARSRVYLNGAGYDVDFMPDSIFGPDVRQFARLSSALDLIGIGDVSSGYAIQAVPTDEFPVGAAALPTVECAEFKGNLLFLRGSPSDLNRITLFDGRGDRWTLNVVDRRAVVELPSVPDSIISPWTGGGRIRRERFLFSEPLRPSDIHRLPTGTLRAVSILERGPACM